MCGGTSLQLACCGPAELQDGQTQAQLVSTFTLKRKESEWVFGHFTHAALFLLANENVKMDQSLLSSHKPSPSHTHTELM